MEIKNIRFMSGISKQSNSMQCIFLFLLLILAVFFGPGEW